MKKKILVFFLLFSLIFPMFSPLSQATELRFFDGERKDFKEDYLGENIEEYKEEIPELYLDVPEEKIREAEEFQRGIYKDPEDNIKSPREENTEKIEENISELKKEEPTYSFRNMKDDGIYVGESVDKDGNPLKKPLEDQGKSQEDDLEISEFQDRTAVRNEGRVVINSHDFIWEGNVIKGLTAEGKAKLDSLKDPNDEVIFYIDSEAEGIADWAFYKQAPKVGNITICFLKNSNLKFIGQGAFFGAGVKNFGTMLQFPKTLERVGPYAFANNRIVNSIIFTPIQVQRLDIGKYAFAQAFMENIMINTSVEFCGGRSLIGEDTRLIPADINIGEGAFHHGEFTTLVGGEHFTMPAKHATVYRIAFGAMADDAKLTIGDKAFSGCNGSKLILPYNVVEIGDSAFENNNFTGSFPYINDKNSTSGSIYDDSSTQRKIFQNSNIKEFKLERIGKAAFSNAGFTGDLILGPQTYTDNGETFNVGGFPNLREIGEGAFSHTGFTGKLKLEGLPIEEVKSLTFYGGFNANNVSESPYFKEGLELINLPNLKTIGNKTFTHFLQSDKDKKSINLQETRALNKEYGFNSITLKNLPNLISLGEHAFQDSKFEGDLDLSEVPKLSTVGSHAFSNAGFTGKLKVSENNSLKDVNESAFFNTGFSGVEFNKMKNLESIGKTAFAGARFYEDGISLDGLSNLKTIGESSFQESGPLANEGYTVNKLNVKLNNLPNVGEISEKAFAHTNFKGDLEISGLPNLTTIKKEAFGIFYKDSDETRLKNNLKNQDDKGFENLSLKDLPKLKSIEESAFRNNKFKGILNLSSLTALETLGDYAFGWNGFTCIDLPDSVTSIGTETEGQYRHAFVMNNKNFKGKIQNLDQDNERWSEEFFNLPIFSKTLKDLKEDDKGYGEYKVSTEGSCAKLNAKKVIVKVTTPKGEDDRLKTLTIKLLNPKQEEEQGSNTKGDNKTFEIDTPTNKDWKVVIDKENGLTPEEKAKLEVFDFDKIPEFNGGKEIPEFINKESKVNISVPYKKANLTINYVDVETGEAISDPDQIKDLDADYKNLINGKYTSRKDLNPKVIDTYDFVDPDKNKETYKDSNVLKDSKGTYTNVGIGENTITLYYKKIEKTITITKISDSTNKPMPCIEYGIYESVNGEKGKLIQKAVTDENGKIKFSLSKDVIIEELRMVPNCNKCDGKPCTDVFKDYVPNKKPTPVNYKDTPTGTDVIYKGYQISFQVPETGTLGLIPYIVLALALGGSAFFLLKKRKKEEKK